MFCAISGQAPLEPVVSKHTGLLFERKLITELIANNGALCPVTSTPLTPEDLIPLRTNPAVKPRAPTSSSIPSMLGALQDEWDSLALETFSLRKQLYAVRQELSHALYQHDAAVRTIARLLKERDERSSATVQAAQPHVAPKSKRGADDDNAEDAGKRARVTDVAPELPDDVRASLEAKAQQLQSARKKRPVPPGTPSAADVGRAYGPLSPWALVGAGDGEAVAAVDADSASVLLVGTKGAAAVVDGTSGSASATYTQVGGTGGDVTSACMLSSGSFVVASADGAVRMFQPGSETASATASPLGDGAHLEVAAHVATSGHYLLAASSSGGWVTLDTTAGLRSVSASAAAARKKGDAIPCITSHPDGLLFATASSRDDSVCIYDIKAGKAVTTLAEGADGGTVSMSFCENGYFFAAGGVHGVRVFDLRKMRILATCSPEGNGRCGAVRFDKYGGLLSAAWGGGVVSIYESKKDFPRTWCSEASSSAGAARAVSFNANATRVVAGWEAGGLTVFGM